VGSALVTNNGEGLDLAAITEWANQIAELCQLTAGKWSWCRPAPSPVVMQRLGWRKAAAVRCTNCRPRAAVGQMGLVQVL
jgi:glutamate 5-kinase